MSKITLKGILLLIELLMSILDKALELIVKIADLIDDGKLNGSAVVPSWYRYVWKVQDYISAAMQALSELARDDDFTKTNE